MYVSFDHDQLRAPYINIYIIGSGSSSSSSRPRQWWPCRPWRARRESARRALAAIQEKRNRRAPRGRSPRGRSKKNPAGFQRRGHESLAARRVTRCGGARVDLDHDGRRRWSDGWPSSSSRQRARGVAALPAQFWKGLPLEESVTIRHRPIGSPPSDHAAKKERTRLVTLLARFVDGKCELRQEFDGRVAGC